jgi:hypothetical protein
MTAEDWANTSNGLNNASIGFSVAAFVASFTPLAPVAPVLLVASDALSAGSLAIDCIQGNWDGKCRAQLLVFAVSQQFGGIVKSSLRPILTSDDFVRAWVRTSAVFDLPQDVVWLFAG